MPDYKVYQDGSQRVQRAWMRGNYRGEDGRVCLVQSVLDAEGRSGRILQEQRIMQIDAELSRFWTYRLIRASVIHKQYSVQTAIEAWNDLPWRRKKSVVAVLDAVGVSVLLDELSQLQIEITNLKAENDALKERVVQLERENKHLFRRLRNYSKLQDARDELGTNQGLLDDMERELQKMIEDSKAHS